MSDVLLKNGTVIAGTTVFLPKPLVERAKALKINRTRLFRETLAAEIERLEKEEEQGFLAANQEAPAHPPEGRRLELDPTSG